MVFSFLYTVSCNCDKNLTPLHFISIWSVFCVFVTIQCFILYSKCPRGLCCVGSYCVKMFPLSVCSLCYHMDEKCKKYKALLINTQLIQLRTRRHGFKQESFKVVKPQVLKLCFKPCLNIDLTPQLTFALSVSPDTQQPFNIVLIRYSIRPFHHQVPQLNRFLRIIVLPTTH